MISLTRERFEQLVADALDALPPQFGKVMENIYVTVEDRDPERHLLGLYQGIPLTERGPMSYSAAMPDHITLFQDIICQLCSTEDEVKEQVQRTMIHEVAHYFGLSDLRLKELGWG